jgi:hypothetical protein
MLTIGLALLALTIFGLWLCLPGADGAPSRYLRHGMDVLAAIAITSGLGISVIFVLAGFAP